MEKATQLHPVIWQPDAGLYTQEEVTLAVSSAGQARPSTSNFYLQERMGALCGCYPELLHHSSYPVPLSPYNPNRA